MYTMTITQKFLIAASIFFAISNPLMAGSRSGPIAITATEANLYGGGYSKASVYLNCVNSDGKIRRPLIVFEDCDAAYIKSGEGGMTRIDDFLTRISGDTSNEGQPTGIETLLGDTVSAYDIIYVEWENSIDYLQNNELVAEAVIKWVNNNKVATGGIKEKNVIVGSGMGNIIAGMALKRMEDAHSIDSDKPSPDTRLLISDDSVQ